MKVTLIETQLLSEYVIRTFAVEKVLDSSLEFKTVCGGQKTAELLC